MGLFEENPPLPESFYTRSDVVQISKDLLGKWLWTFQNGEFTAGKIVETEAYCGETDKACHAHQNRFTKRTRVMFEQGGRAYVYLCYGIHELFNIVTNVEGKADAVLIRAIEPTVGEAIMLERRNQNKLAPTLTAGPGRLTKALAITRELNAEILQSPQVWISQNPEKANIPESEVLAGPRIGIDYAEEDALLPWRFRIKGSKWCSKPNPQK
ncbi:MAG: DNA-3-methyladenine glycosylase [Bacteroidota bacterium]